MTSDDTRNVVVCGVKSMCIDRRSTRLKPDSRRLCSGRYRIADNAGRINPRIHHLPPVLIIVPAIHAPACKVDDNIRTVDLSHPITKRLAVPFRRSPNLFLRRAAEHDNFVAVGVKCSGQHSSDLSCPAWNYDFHNILVRTASDSDRGSRF